MFEVRSEFAGGVKIAVLGSYRPWGYHIQHGGTADTWPEHSVRTIRLKNRKIPAINYFADYLAGRLQKNGFEAIAVVPSHDPEKWESGVRDLAAKLVATDDVIDAGACLVRHTKIEKLANGGDRSIGVHLNSLAVEHVDLIAGRKVLVIDDVMTSGNSLAACRHLLLQAGARQAACLALAKTTY
jgi:predicted amidophosphoribosyltransferase